MKMKMSEILHAALTPKRRCPVKMNFLLLGPVPQNSKGAPSTTSLARVIWDSEHGGYEPSLWHETAWF